MTIDSTEIELDKLWSDERFDEDNLSEIEGILTKKSSYVDFFVRKIDINSSQMDALYLIILTVIPLEICVLYAIEQDAWDIGDFSEYGWFQGVDTFNLISLSDYEYCLSNQIFRDGRNK